MRTVKFRVWDKQKKEFFSIKNALVLCIGNTDKFLAYSTNQGLYPIPNTGQKDLGWDRWVLQQFTGLLDKNGNEIYEGDIIWYDAYFNLYKKIVWDKCGFNLNDIVDEINYWEIKGNIFENKELLE